MPTVYSSRDALVLQICPEVKIGKVRVNGREEYRTYTDIFLPDPTVPGNTISCPFNYFQERASLPQKWILDDSSRKIAISNADKFNTVVLTKKIDSVEERINLPPGYSERILDYLKLDVPHNSAKYKGFDCYAFVSFLANLKVSPENPPFEYKLTKPNVGDIVVLANKNNLPSSIMHWALFLGSDLYLSKFGKSGEGAQSLLEVMDLQGMMKLYSCERTYTAYPKS